MAVTEGTARSTAIIGIIELVLALIAIICGGVAMSKMTSPARVTIGIWALYVSTKELAPCPQDSYCVLKKQWKMYLLVATRFPVS